MKNKDHWGAISKIIKTCLPKEEMNLKKNQAHYVHMVRCFAAYAKVHKI